METIKCPFGSVCLALDLGMAEKIAYDTGFADMNRT